MTPTPLSSREAGWIILYSLLALVLALPLFITQPLLPLMGANLHLSVEGMGLVLTLTQAGYAGHSVSAAARRSPRPADADST